METCSIVIASYNDAQNLNNCLRSIRHVDYPKEDFEIIVIDNTSTDNTAEIVRQYHEVSYLKEEKRGPSFARNKGIKQAKGEILVFLDSDTKVTGKWLNYITEPFKNKDVGAVGGAIRPFNENNIISRYLSVSLFSRYHRYGKQREVKGYPTCNLAIRKDLIYQGFNASLFASYFEDKDICYRILERGFKIVFQPKAVIYHKHPTSPHEFFNKLIKSSKGRAAFASKYPSAPDILLLNFHFPLIYPLAVIISLLLWNLPVFVFLLMPGLFYFLSTSIISYIESKDFLLSFFVKPTLDIISIYVIYISYHWSISLKKGH